MNVSDLQSMIAKRMIQPRPKGYRSGGEIIAIEGILRIFGDYRTGEGKFGHYSFQKAILEQKGDPDTSIDVEFVGFDRFDEVTEYVQFEAEMTENGLVGLAVVMDEYEDKNGQFRSQNILRVTPKARIFGLERADAGSYPRPETPPAPPPQGERADFWTAVSPEVSRKDDNINRQCAAKAACVYYAGKTVPPEDILALANCLYNWTMGSYRSSSRPLPTHDAPRGGEAGTNPEKDVKTPDEDCRALQAEIRRICNTDDDPKGCWAQVAKRHGLSCRPEDITDKKVLKAIIDDLDVPF